MKALILAAGRGTRIHSVHGDHPKCLIRFNGDNSTILDHQIDSLFSAGVASIGIVVWYEKDQVIHHVVKNYGNDRKLFHFIENPAFATTNNIYSFWLAQTWINREPFVCLNADVVFDPRILIPALRSIAPITMVVDPKWRDETMKVIVSQGRVIRMSKRILQSEFSGTYIGITAFAADVQQRVFAKINDLIRTGNENEFLMWPCSNSSTKVFMLDLPVRAICLGPRSMIPAIWSSRESMYSPTLVHARSRHSRRA
jgi:choline kinase